MNSVSQEPLDRSPLSLAALTHAPYALTASGQADSFISEKTWVNKFGLMLVDIHWEEAYREIVRFRASSIVNEMQVPE